MENSIFKFRSNCKKMIFILDDQGLLDSLPIINLHKVNKKDISINYISDKDDPATLGFDDTLLNHSINRFSTIDSKTLRSMLGGQKIGTHIFVSGSWSMINLVKDIAGRVGYSDAEMQYKAFGEKIESIYCVKCYSYNTKTQSNVIICDHCNTKLDVSGHFSRRLDAYLGYIHLA